MRLVLAEVGGAPTHHAGVEDAPDTRADVTGMEAHIRLEHGYD